MATVKEVMELLKDLPQDKKLYVGYSDYDELECSIFTEETIISRANERGGLDEETITEVDTALSYLADMDYDFHFAEIEV